jgi:uncharacterized protein
MTYPVLFPGSRRLSLWLRQHMVLGLVAGALVFGVGCGPVPDPVPPTASDRTASPIPTDVPMADPRAQQLPITAVTTLGGEEIFLEVATTPQQQSLGLMYRDVLPTDRGMLFPLGRPRPVSFWMKNVPVPLDMVFVYQGTIQAIAADVPPCTAEPCPTYGPDGQLIDQVIELRAGRSAELGLSVGDAVVIRPLTP